MRRLADAPELDGLMFDVDCEVTLVALFVSQANAAYVADGLTARQLRWHREVFPQQEVFESCRNLVSSATLNQAYQRIRQPAPRSAGQRFCIHTRLIHPPEAVRARAY